MKFEPDGNVTSFGELNAFRILQYVQRVDVTQETLMIISERHTYTQMQNYNFLLHFHYGIC